MPDYSAGTASIRIKPDASDFVRDLRAKMSAIKDPGFDVRVSADLDPARRETREWREAEERNDVDVDVEPNTKAATAEMEQWRRRQEARPVNVRVTVDHQRAGRQLGELEKRLESLRRSDALRLNVGAFASAAIGPALTGLAQLAAGIQQVSQSALVLPGALGGASASIGTLVLGLSGLKDAYTAASAAAESSGKDQESSARAAAAAQTAYRNAVVDNARAQRDVATAYRDARTELRDLNLEMQGGMLDESRAILEARKAREELARGKFSDIRDQVLRIAEADQRLAEVRARNADTAAKLADANSKGIANSDRVADANERLTRTQQQVADAQLAVADASSKTSAAQDKAAAAMAKLGPNAQALLKTWIDMTPQFLAFRNAISQPLLEGKAEEFRGFVNEMLPIVEKGGVSIAKAWNDNISALFGAVSSDEGKGLLDRILGNTADAQSRLSAAMKPLVEGFGTLTAAGTGALPRIADAFTDVLTRFRDFIVEADKDGRLDKWINDGLDGLTNVGNAVLNIGKSFTAITQASGGGRTFTEWLRDATDKLQTFLNSPNGQNKLAEFFASGKEAWEQIKPALKELPDLFRAISDGAQTYVGGLLSIVTPLADFLGEHPTLVKTAIAAWLTWNTVRPVTEGVLSAIGMINTGVIGIGTNFAGTRQKVTDEMKRVDKSFADAGHKNSGLGKLTGAVSAFSGAGGVGLALLTTVGVPLVMQFVENINRGMDDAKEHIDAVEQSARGLIGTLDDVTNLTGLATRRRVADELGAPSPPGGAGLVGSALTAAAALGVGGQGGQDIVTAALPGGEQLYQQYMKQARDAVRPTVQNYLKQFPGDVQQFGLTEDTIVDAFLGDPNALSQVRGALTRSAAFGTGPSGAFDLGKLGEQVLRDRPDVINWSILLQRLNYERSSVNSAVGQATQAQAAATPQPQLRPEFAGQFPGAVVNSDGSSVTIVTTAPPGSFPVDPGTQVQQGVPPNQDKWTYRLSPEDAQKYTQIPGGTGVRGSYRAGSTAPTPGGRNQGFLAMLHGQEWVHNADTTAMYGPEVMAAMSRGQIDPRLMRSLVPHFDQGGYIDENGNPVTPGQMPGPTAPNPFGATTQGTLPGILEQTVQGFHGPVSNAVGIATTGLGALSAPSAPLSPAAASAPATIFPAGTPGSMLPGGNYTQLPDGSLLLEAAPLPAPPGFVGPMRSLLGALGADNPSSPIGGLLSNLGPFAGLNSDPQSFWNFLNDTGTGTYSGQQGNDPGAWLANWGLGLVTNIGKNLLKGGLSLFGLENSILSPTNPYNQAITQSITHFGNLAGAGILQGMFPGSQSMMTGDMLSLYGPGAPSSVYGNTGAVNSYVASLKPGQTVSMDTVAGWPRLYAPGVDGNPPVVPADVQNFVKSFGSGSLVAGTRDTGDTLHQAGFAFDISGKPEDMQALADYVSTNLKDSTLQLIYSGLRGNQHEISAGGYVGDGYYSGHSNHVHWAPAPGVFGAQLATANNANLGWMLPTSGLGAGESLIGTPQAGHYSLKAVAKQMYLAAGLPPGEWGAFDQLITRESSWNPTAKNPSSTAYGLGQFLDSTWDDVGGAYTSDPAMQLEYVFRYLRQRYSGSPANALQFHNEHNWYDNGGWLPPGISLAINGTGKPEPIITHDQARAIQALAKNTEQPALPRGPQAQQMVPRAQAPSQGAKPMVPGAAPGGPQGPTAPTAPLPSTPAQVAPPPRFPTRSAPQVTNPVAATPDNLDSVLNHNLPAVSTAITSTASALGQAVSTAIGIAAGLGAGAPIPGGGAIGLLGAIGPYAAGAVMQGGKIVEDVANVVSSFLVGNVPGSGQTTDSAYGETLQPPQRELATAGVNGGQRVASYGPFYGHDTASVMREINLHESLEQQTAYANRSWPGGR